MKSVPEQALVSGNGSSLRTLSEAQIEAGERAFFNIMGPFDIDAHTLRILLKATYKAMKGLENARSGAGVLSEDLQ